MIFAKLRKLFPMEDLRPILKKLRFIGLFMGLVFIAILLLPLLRAPEWIQAHVSICGVLLATMVGLLGNALIGAVFAQLVGKTSPTSSRSSRFKAYYFTQIVKYVPGRITALLAQQSLLAGNTSMSATIVSNIELIGITAWLCTGAALSLLAFPHSIFLATAIAIVFVLVGVFLIRVEWISLATRAVRYFLGKPLLRWQAEVDSFSYPQAVILSAGILVLPALSIYLLVAIGMRMEANIAIAFTAILLLSWVGGTIAFIFPAGIGIREFVFYVLGRTVTSMNDPEILAGVALMSRVTQICIDLIGSAIFVIWLRFRRDLA